MTYERNNREGSIMRYQTIKVQGSIRRLNAGFDLNRELHMYLSVKANDSRSRNKNDEIHVLSVDRSAPPSITNRR